MSNDLTCVTIERHDERPLTLVLHGDVNIYCAGLLHESADYLDTSALQILLALRQGLLAQGRSLRMTGVSAGMESLLGLAGVPSVFCCQVAAQSK
jgi:hypothetical protein